MKLCSILLLVGVATSVNAFCATDFPEVVNTSACDSGNCAAADVFGGKDPVIWGRTFANMVAIRYCFYDTYTDVRSRKVVWDAMDAWMGALGGERNKENGHAIQFREEVNPHTNKPLHCADETNPNAPWNPRIRPGALCIYFRGADGKNPHPEPYSYATIGHMSNPAPFDLYLSLGTNHMPWAITHELGHVLGMVHEHQRPDRDVVVAYNCDKVEGFDAAWRKASADGVSKERLCGDRATADKYGFQTGREFIKGWTGGVPWKVVGRGVYDVESIMHYASDFGTQDVSKCSVEHPGEPDKCALAFWKNPSNHNAGWETRFRQNPISKSDVAWVKKTYPWDENQSGWGGPADKGQSLFVFGDEAKSET